MFFTIQKPNFETFGFRLDSVFECSEFEPPLYLGVLYSDPHSMSIKNIWILPCCSFWKNWSNFSSKVKSIGAVKSPKNGRISSTDRSVKKVSKRFQQQDWFSREQKVEKV